MTAWLINELECALIVALIWGVPFVVCALAWLVLRDEATRQPNK